MQNGTQQAPKAPVQPAAKKPTLDGKPAPKAPTPPPAPIREEVQGKPVPAPIREEVQLHPSDPMYRPDPEAKPVDVGIDQGQEAEIGMDSPADETKPPLKERIVLKGRALTAAIAHSELKAKLRKELKASQEAMWDAVVKDNPEFDSDTFSLDVSLYEQGTVILEPNTDCCGKLPSELKDMIRDTLRGHDRDSGGVLVGKGLGALIDSLRNH